jgi:hypothetical protein
VVEVHISMTTHADHGLYGLSVGPWSGIGAGIGLVFALLSGAELPLGLVFGAALGSLVGLAVDALGAPRHGDHEAEIRHPAERD